MKKYLFLVIATLMSLNSFSQSFEKDSLKIGYKVGLNFNIFSPSDLMSYAYGVPSIKEWTISPFTLSPTVGFIFYYPLKNKLFLAPQINLYSSYSTDYLYVEGLDSYSNIYKYDINGKNICTGLELPLFVGYNLSKKFNIKVGPSIRLFNYWHTFANLNLIDVYGGNIKQGAGSNFKFIELDLIKLELSYKINNSSMLLFQLDSDMKSIFSNDVRRYYLQVSFAKYFKN